MHRHNRRGRCTLRPGPQYEHASLPHPQPTTAVGRVVQDRLASALTRGRCDRIIGHRSISPRAQRPTTALNAALGFAGNLAHASGLEHNAVKVH